MNYALFLYFNDDFTGAAQNCWEQLAKKGIADILEQALAPHLTLAIFDSLPENFQFEFTKIASEQTVLNLQGSSIAFFPSSKPTVFLNFNTNFALINLYQRYYNLLTSSNCNINRFSHPEEWLPHCTLAIKINPLELPHVLEVCARVFNFPCAIDGNEIALVDLNTGEELWSQQLATCVTA